MSENQKLQITTLSGTINKISVSKSAVSEDGQVIADVVPVTMVIELSGYLFQAEDFRRLGDLLGYRCRMELIIDEATKRPEARSKKRAKQ